MSMAVFHFVPELFRTIAAFALVLGVLVFIHEMGHYLAARWRGVYVEAFSIGFGRALASWTDRRGTVWKLAWLPLGGYVKLHGQERPEDVSDEVRAAWRPGFTFHEKSVGSRAIIVAAGPIANFILAIVLFAGLFAAVGRPVAVPVVREIMPNSAASAAGLMVGDRIDLIDGEAIHRFEDIQRIVSVHAGVPIALTVHRGQTDIALSATPLPNGAGTGSKGGAGSTGVLGVRGGTLVFEPISPIAAIPAGVVQTWEVARDTLVGLWTMISGRGSTDDLGGPLRIAQLSGQVAQLGFGSLVSFIAVLSVNLGLINLFPIPVLDGGHLLFYFAEALRGRPLPQRALEYGFRAGFAVLIALFMFATWNDLSHFGLVKWVAGLIG